MSSRILAALAFLSAALCLASMAGWAVSQGEPGEVSCQPLGDPELALGYREGCLLVAVLDQDPSPPRWWRPSGLRVSDLDDGLDFRTDVWSWAVSVPFPLLIVIFAITPAWWILVYRERRELIRRVQLGLCLNCGYDIRANTDGICSECGVKAIRHSAARLAAWRG